MNTVEQKYLDDLGLYQKTLDAMKGAVKLPTEQMEILNGLLLKFFYHSGTVFELYKGSKIDQIGAYYWDFSSVAVIVRSALETFAVFHYLFVEPRTEDEIEFRFCQFRLEGLLIRSHSTRIDVEAKEMLNVEAKEMENLRKRIAATKAFEELSRKAQNQALKAKSTPQKTDSIKRALATLSPDLSIRLYAFLSTYAHTGYISVFQPMQADTKDKQMVYLQSFMNMLRVVMFHMVVSLIWKFPVLEENAIIKSEILKRGHNSGFQVD